MKPSFTLLPDPMSDRVSKSTPLPIFKRIGDEDIYTKDAEPNASPTGAPLPSWPNLKYIFEHEGRLQKATCLRILREVTAILKAEPNIL